MTNEKPDINDFALALSEDDYSDAMRELGYNILYFDEYTEEDVYFIKEYSFDCIIRFNFNLGQFWCYPIANNGFIRKDKLNEKEKNRWN